MGFELRSPGLNFDHDFGLFLNPGIMEDFLHLWGDMILNRFFHNHFEYGVFKLRADGGDPSFNAWVKIAKGAGKGFKVSVLVDNVRDKAVYD